MSWDDQVSAEKSRDLVFGLETAFQALMLRPLNMIYGLTESVSQLGRGCDMTCNCDTLSHNVTHNTDLWDGDYHVMLLFGYDIYLKANAKMLATSLMCLVCFIQKHPLKSHPIEQFSSILGISSYIWRLLQAVSETS